MRDALLTLGFVVAIFLAVVAQEALPPLAMAEGARVYLVPVLFCCGACFLPFPSMILLALVAGFLADFTTLQFTERVNVSSDLYPAYSALAAVEIPGGWSILLFVAAGLICQGLRPLVVVRGHWWLPVLMSGAVTVVYLALQFGIITARRFEEGGLFWSDTVAWRILAPGLLASLFAMVLVLMITLAGGPGHGGRRGLRDY